MRSIELNICFKVFAFCISLQIFPVTAWCVGSRQVEPVQSCVKPLVMGMFIFALPVLILFMCKVNDPPLLIHFSCVYIWHGITPVSPDVFRPYWQRTSRCLLRLPLQPSLPLSPVASVTPLFYILFSLRQIRLCNPRLCQNFLAEMENLQWRDDKTHSCLANIWFINWPHSEVWVSWVNCHLSKLSCSVSAVFSVFIAVSRPPHTGSPNWQFGLISLNCRVQGRTADWSV